MATNTGKTGDPFFDHFLAGTGPSQADMAQSHRDAQRGGAALLDEIGRSILLTHSAGGPTGWLVADARPDYEYEESRAKRRAVLSAIELALGQADWP